MLVAKNISKKFSGITALVNVNLELHPGKVNAIIGENGAGKSTLMKIFSGVHTQYEGEILFKGKPVKFTSARQAEDAGITIIHQELNLVPYLSIAENIFLGRELTNAFGMVDKKRMNQEAMQLLARLNLDISPVTKIATLKVGQQQLVEIAKALYTNAEVIIMDEPTSAISEKEVENIYQIIHQLKAEGKTIVYISHKLKEVFAIADRFIVLRDGSTIESGNIKEVSQDELIHKMIGREIKPEKRSQVTSNTTPLMVVKNICLKHPLLKTRNLLQDISFQLYKGEILGLYGLMGAGRTELMECIFGLHPKRSSGEIIVNGACVKMTSPANAIAAGIALVPEDRKQHGLILNQAIRSNISITVLEKLQNRWGILSAAKEKKLSGDYIDRLAIKTSSDKKMARQLSGGNQQKIVLAKWLATHPAILLLDEPTRGIDINAKAEIYKLIKSLAAAGMGVIMVSSEMPEILAVSDRIMVMAEGELTAIIPIDEATEAIILKNAISKNNR